MRSLASPNETHKTADIRPQSYHKGQVHGDQPLIVLRQHAAPTAVWKTALFNYIQGRMLSTQWQECHQ